MKVYRDSRGQMSVDFLIGITIFILAFIYLMVAIPQMFTPFQSNSDELTMMADRVGATLIESKLVATDAAGQPLPGIVDANKVAALKNALTLDEIGERKKLGLSDGDLANPTVYHVQIELNEYYSNSPTVVESFPNAAAVGQNVGQSRRFVYLRDAGALMSSEKYWPGVRTILVVRVW